jgi:Phage derived protein Gp49-like (DUF891)
MNILRVGDRRWVVLMSEQVLEELNHWGSAKGPKNAMLSLLTQSVPAHGPQESNPVICIPLRGTDDLFEFRKREYRGPHVRVLWFYGDPGKTIIVCARAFVKTFPQTPAEEIDLATAFKHEYHEAVKGKSLIVEEGADLIRRK